MTDTRFECPKCHKDCCMIHVGKTHFGTCKKCGIGWMIGYNLFTVPEDIKASADANMKYLEANFEHVDLEDF